MPPKSTRFEQLLARVQANDPNLTRLDLSFDPNQPQSDQNSSLNDADIEVLVDALRDNTHVTSLDLTRNRISEKGITAIAQMLKTNIHITTLKLAETQLNDEGALALAQMLKINESITTLDLARAQISNAGVEHISQVLKVNTTLRDLNLDGNSFDNIGARSLAEAIAVNQSLWVVNLYHNQIGFEGAKALVESLKKNQFIFEFEFMMWPTSMPNVNENDEDFLNLKCELMNEQATNLCIAQIRYDLIYSLIAIFANGLSENLNSLSIELIYTLCSTITSIEPTQIPSFCKTISPSIEKRNMDLAASKELRVQKGDDAFEKEREESVVYLTQCVFGSTPGIKNYFISHKNPIRTAMSFFANPNKEGTDAFEKMERITVAKAQGNPADASSSSSNSACQGKH